MRLENWKQKKEQERVMFPVGKQSVEMQGTGKEKRGDQ